MVTGMDPHVPPVSCHTVLCPCALLYLVYSACTHLGSVMTLPWYTFPMVSHTLYAGLWYQFLPSMQAYSFALPDQP